jgi:hypothetical protein
LKQRLLNHVKERNEVKRRCKQAWADEKEAAAAYHHAVQQHSLGRIQQVPQQQLEHLAAQVADAKEQLQATHAEVLEAEAACQHNQNTYLDLKSKTMRKKGQSEADIQAFIKARAKFCMDD